MSRSEAILEAIRQRRETRDRIMLQNLMPILRQLRETVDRWIDDEFKDFEDEVSHVDSFAPTDSASERISGFLAELTQIRNEQLPKALQKLDELIERIKQQSFKSAGEATDLLRDNVYPIISIVFNLTKARERLDGMADMIPIIELPSPPSHRENDEGE